MKNSEIEKDKKKRSKPKEEKKTDIGLSPDNSLASYTTFTENIERAENLSDSSKSDDKKPPNPPIDDEIKPDPSLCSRITEGYKPHSTKKKKLQSKKKKSGE